MRVRVRVRVRVHACRASSSFGAIAEQVDDQGTHTNPYVQPFATLTHTRCGSAVCASPPPVRVPAHAHRRMLMCVCVCVRARVCVCVCAPLSRAIVGQVRVEHGCQHALPRVTRRLGRFKRSAYNCSQWQLSNDASVGVAGLRDFASPSARTPTMHPLASPQHVPMAIRSLTDCHAWFMERLPFPGSSTCVSGGAPVACHWNDTSQAEAYAHTLTAFYVAFPEYQTNDLYLTGESYAGQYVPAMRPCVRVCCVCVRVCRMCVASARPPARPPARVCVYACAARAGPHWRIASACPTWLSIQLKGTFRTSLTSSSTRSRSTRTSTSKVRHRGSSRPRRKARPMIKPRVAESMSCGLPRAHDARRTSPS